MEEVQKIGVIVQKGSERNVAEINNVAVRSETACIKTTNAKRYFSYKRKDWQYNL